MTDLDKMAHEIAQRHERFGDWGYEDMVDAIRDALLTAPPGWKLVPVEPTDEMVDAASEAHMPFGDMHFAISSAILAAPEVK